MHTREQERARYAHECIDQVTADERAGYRTLANDFGANIMRCGLCAALAFVERERGRMDAADRFLDHLAGHLTGGGRGVLPDGVSGADLHARIRTLAIDDYMVLTREALHLALWLRRATQARISPSSADSAPNQESSHA